MSLFSFNSRLVRLGDAIQKLILNVITFQFQIGAIGSRTTTQKNKLILNKLTSAKLLIFSQNVVEPPECIFPGSSTICRNHFISNMSKNSGKFLDSLFR
jgi:hypothetical protein